MNSSSPLSISLPHLRPSEVSQLLQVPDRGRVFVSVRLQDVLYDCIVLFAFDAVCWRERSKNEKRKACVCVCVNVCVYVIYLIQKRDPWRGSGGWGVGGFWETVHFVRCNLRRWTEKMKTYIKQIWKQIQSSYQTLHFHIPLSIDYPPSLPPLHSLNLLSLSFLWHPHNHLPLIRTQTLRVRFSFHSPSM